MIVCYIFRNRVFLQEQTMKAFQGKRVEEILSKPSNERMTRLVLEQAAKPDPDAPKDPAAKLVRALKYYKELAG